MIELDKLFVTVRDYLYDHPEANVVQTSQATGVQEEIILEFLKQGRLELSEPSLSYVCERCGRPITTGRYCRDCINELDREMKKGLSEATRNSRNLGRDSSRMHISEYYIKKRDK
jgi:hypothetical protein